MIETESDMWDALKSAGKHLPSLARIETGITRIGVSDVEYVTDIWHGWVELKCSKAKGDAAKLVFGSPFKLEQLTWLATHHNPVRCLRSWLLIAHPCAVGTEWLSVAPKEAALIFSGKVQTFGELRKLRAVRRTCEASSVIATWEKA